MPRTQARPRKVPDDPVELLALVLLFLATWPLGIALAAAALIFLPGWWLDR